MPGWAPPINHQNTSLWQVRHPDLQRAFSAEFAKWFLSTKRACKRWKSDKKLRDTAVPHLLSLVCNNLTRKVVSSATAEIAKRLGRYLLLTLCPGLTSSACCKNSRCALSGFDCRWRSCQPKGLLLCATCNRQHSLHSQPWGQCRRQCDHQSLVCCNLQGGTK